MIYNTKRFDIAGTFKGEMETLVLPQPRLEVPNVVEDSILNNAMRCRFWNDYLTNISCKYIKVPVSKSSLEFLFWSRELNRNVREDDDNDVTVSYKFTLDYSIHAGDIVLTFIKLKGGRVSSQPSTISRIRRIIRPDQDTLHEMPTESRLAKPNIMSVRTDLATIIGY